MQKTGKQEHKKRNLGRQNSCWDILCASGLPMTSFKTKKIKPTSKLLIKNLLLAIRELRMSSCSIIDLERKRESLIALILSLKIHYPEFFNKLASSFPSIRRMLPKKINGRIIKLKRIAEERLAQYL